MSFWPSEKATALALRVHTSIALSKPNAASIPIGPWPKPKPKRETATQAVGVTVDDIVAVIKAHPEGLTATEVQQRLGVLNGGINGLLKRRIARGEIEVTRENGNRAVYRAAK